MKTRITIRLSTETARILRSDPRFADKIQTIFGRAYLSACPLTVERALARAHGRDWFRLQGVA